MRHRDLFKTGTVVPEQALRRGNAGVEVTLHQIAKTAILAKYLCAAQNELRKAARKTNSRLVSG